MLDISSNSCSKTYRRVRGTSYKPLESTEHDLHRQRLHNPISDGERRRRRRRKRQSSNARFQMHLTHSSALCARECIFDMATENTRWALLVHETKPDYNYDPFPKYTRGTRSSQVHLRVASFAYICCSFVRGSAER